MKLTAKQVLERLRWPENLTPCPSDLCDVSELILNQGPPCGGNEVELAHLAPRLAAMVMIHFGQGDLEIDTDDDLTPR